MHSFDVCMALSCEKIHPPPIMNKRFSDTKFE